MSDRPPFEQRFQNVVDKMRLTRVLTVLGWAAVALTATVVVLACIDYFLETGWSFRAATMGLAGLAALATAGVLVLQVLQRWTRRSTAAQVEKRFEDLGQSVRTVVQFRDDDGATDGVSPSLLGALNDDVRARTEELRLTEAIATGPLKISVVMLGLLGIIAMAACFSSWDWRMAGARALLGNKPYTTVEAKEGDTRVDEKATFTLNTSVSGRTNRRVQLKTRPLDAEADATWDVRPLLETDTTKKEVRFVSYAVDIPKVKKPFEYQVVAGKYASPVHRVDVRYPLAIQAFNIELTPPEYTGIGTQHLDKGSFDTVEGTFARIEIELDHAPDRAWLEMRPIITPLGEEPTIDRVDLSIDGPLLSTDMDLYEDRFYEVVAEKDDGTRIRPNRYRIRVHEDRPPKLAFATPEQLTEVHPLAELLMKLRISDDYGLRRAGIVFQRNNEEEVELEDIPYEDIEMQDGRLTPQTKATIESLFPLEYFNLTVNDSISYYGYAEDNRPDSYNRNETDLHFIDVRPFRRQFRQPEDENGLNGMGNDDNDNPNRRSLPQLNDMINRERFVLNRTMQMKRQDDRGKSIDANAIDNLIQTQNEGSDLTFEMAQVAEQIEQTFQIPENGRISELLFQARQSMLDSIDSLANTEFEVAKLQEKDALQHLINARQRLDDPTSPANSGRGGGGAALRRAFRRMRTQQPRNNSERAREIVRRLKQAAAEQEFLMDKMTDLVPPEMPEREDDETEQQEDAEEQQDEDQEEMEDQDQQQQEGDDADEEQDEMENEEEREQELNDLRRELEEDQNELTEDIRDVVDMIEELTQISSLAGQRTNRALSGIDGINGALERGNTREAMNNAGIVSDALRILADNIDGITADEATRRLEIARDLGLTLTDDLRQLNGNIDSAQQKLDETDAEGNELANLQDDVTIPLAERAEQQAEIAKTIQDILDSIVDPEMGIQDSEDRMVKRIQEIMDETEFVESTGRLQQLPDIINGMDWSLSSAQVEDLGDRFEIASQRLDAMHREILSPRLAQLRRLEKRALEVNNAMQNLQADDQVNRWHMRTDGLLDDIESAKVAEAQAQAMREAMVEAGWGSSNDWDWEANASATALTPPETYGSGLGDVISEIQRHILEMSMIDTEVTNTGAIPPRYRAFVDRYMEVLSGATQMNAETEE